MCVVWSTAITCLMARANESRLCRMTPLQLYISLSSNTIFMQIVLTTIRCRRRRISQQSNEWMCWVRCTFRRHIINEEKTHQQKHFFCLLTCMCVAVAAAVAAAMTPIRTPVAGRQWWKLRFGIIVTLSFFRIFFFRCWSFNWALQWFKWNQFFRRIEK